MREPGVLFPSIPANAVPPGISAGQADRADPTGYRGHAAMRNRACRPGPAQREDIHMPFSGEGIIITLVIGLIAGWAASKIVSGTGLGLIGDIVVGIIGAFIAAWLFPRLGIALGTGMIREIIDAIIGAIILLVIVKLVRRAM
jgi:uncharacterized membrane protein YeaQ/YmgE (transglycosylase-associated protein family)